MPLTNAEFRQAIGHLVKDGTITGTKPYFLDINNQRLLDEGNNNADLTPDEATLQQALIDANAEQSAQADRDAQKATLRQQVSVRMANELVKATPDWATLYTDISTMIAGTTPLVNALNNINALYSDVWVLVGLTQSQQRKLQILCFMQVIDVWDASE